MLKTDFAPEHHGELPKCPKHNSDMTWLVFLKGRSGCCVTNGSQETRARVGDQYGGYHDHPGRDGEMCMVAVTETQMGTAED